MSYKNPLHKRAQVKKVRFNAYDERRIEKFSAQMRRQEATFLHDMTVLMLDLLEKHNGDLEAVARAS